MLSVIHVYYINYNIHSLLFMKLLKLLLLCMHIYTDEDNSYKSSQRYISYERIKNCCACTDWFYSRV